MSSVNALASVLVYDVRLHTTSYESKIYYNK